MIDSEEWRPVVGYEGVYAVSSSGRVMRVAAGAGTRVGTILKPKPQKSGHLSVGLCVNGVKTRHRVHRLVATAFIPNPDNLPFVLHWDDDPENNSVENLRWGTPQQNTDDIKRNGNRLGRPRGTHCPSGHEYTAENMVTLSGGYEACRICHRDQQRRASRKYEEKRKLLRAEARRAHTEEDGKVLFNA